MVNQSSARNYKALTRQLIREKIVFFLLGFISGSLFLTVFFALAVVPLISALAKKHQEISNLVVKPISIKENAKVYEIREGDTLWKIAEEKYGSGYNAYDIAKINNLSDLDQIVLGQEIVLPNISPKQATVGETTSASTKQVTNTADKYMIQMGDSLSSIAEQFYGDSNMASKIIKANKITNPEIIEPGTILFIPR